MHSAGAVAHIQLLYMLVYGTQPINRHRKIKYIFMHFLLELYWRPARERCANSRARRLFWFVRGDDRPNGCIYVICTAQGASMKHSCVCKRQSRMTHRAVLLPVRSNFMILMMGAHRQNDFKFDGCFLSDVYDFSCCIYMAYAIQNISGYYGFLLLFFLFVRTQFFRKAAVSEVGFRY